MVCEVFFVLCFLLVMLVLSLVVIRVLALPCALLLSHLSLAEFPVDNGRANSEIRRLHGAKHSDYYRLYIRWVYSYVV